jgi:ketosteroid isomerase-like protein
MAKNPTIIALYLLLSANLALAGEKANEHARWAITAQLDQIYELSLAEGAAAELTARQLEYFASLPSIIPPGQEPIIGRRAVADFYQAIFASIRVLENNYAQLEIKIEGNTAVRRYLGFGKLRDGDTVMEVKSRITDVLIIENGEWKTLVHTWLTEK